MTDRKWDAHDWHQQDTRKLISADPIGPLPDPDGALGPLRRAIQGQAARAANNWLEEGIWDTAEATKVELDRVSRLIADKAGPWCVLITSSTKSLGSATRKINNDCDGMWLELKDVARVTLAAEANSDVGKIVDILKDVLVHRDGYTLCKSVCTIAQEDDCGYSGYNYCVRFGPKPDSAVKLVPDSFATTHSVGALQAKTLAALSGNAKPVAMRPIQMSDAQIMASLKKQAPVPGYVGRIGEIQVNTYDMMYGKMDRDTFVSMFKEAKWESCRQKSGIEGGMGHYIYEDWRVDRKSVNGLKLAELSKRYYRRMRGHDLKPAEGVDQLKIDIEEFAASSPSKNKAH